MPNHAVTPDLARQMLPGSFPGDLGIEFLEIADGSAIGRMAVDRRHLHPGGYVHGGVWAAFADTVAAWATMRLLDPGVDFTTSEMKVNVFAAGHDGDVLLATAEALHAGRRTQVWQVHVRREGDERLVATFMCTQIMLGG